MPPRTRTNTPELGATIRDRRVALGLSIEEAAAKAGIGAKSWGRYEAGAAIRADKVRGICRALGWSRLPTTAQEDDDASGAWLEKIDESHTAWSDALDESLGRACAVTFAVGSDVLSDQLADDLASLATERRGTHLGELSASWLAGQLPPQFVPRYDYELIYALKAAVRTMRKRFAAGHLVAHSVLEELALRLIFSQAEVLADLHPEFFGEDDDWRHWLGDILDHLDIEFYLFTSSHVLTPDIPYHFDHWGEMQFYADRFTTPDRAEASPGPLDPSQRQSDRDQPDK